MAENKKPKKNYKKSVKNGVKDVKNERKNSAFYTFEREKNRENRHQSGFAENIEKQNAEKPKSMDYKSAESETVEENKKQTWSGGALLAPVPPCMVTCGSFENPNIITIAWTGIVNTHPPMTYISVRPSRFSYGLIKENMEFAINLVSADLVKKADYCGIYTGKKVNKFEKCGLTKQEASKLNCPIIKESPMSLECKVKEIIHLGTHDMFLAEIVAIDVNENLLDKNGKLCMEKAHLCAFAHGEYFEIGKKIGTFGFSVKKKSK